MTSYVNAMGLAAAILTTGSFLPQVIRTWRKGAADISYLMLFLFLSGILLWFVYGWLLGSAPVMLANGATGIQVLIIAAIKIRKEFSGGDRRSSKTISLALDVKTEL